MNWKKRTVWTVNVTTVQIAACVFSRVNVFVKLNSRFIGIFVSISCQIVNHLPSYFCFWTVGLRALLVCVLLYIANNIITKNGTKYSNGKWFPVATAHQMRPFISIQTQTNVWYKFARTFQAKNRNNNRFRSEPEPESEPHSQI